MGWGLPQTTRLIPIWKLLLPTAFLGLTQYIIIQLARYTVISSTQLEEQARVSIFLVHVPLLLTFSIQWSLIYSDTSVTKLTVRITEFSDK